MANAGMGPNSMVPDSVKKHFNWGVFFLTFFWSIGNNTYAPLVVFAVLLVLSFIPFINLLVPLLSIVLYIWMGIKGNEWAWQNKRWADEEGFHRIQRLWAGWGLGICLIGTVLSVILAILILTSLSSILGSNIKDITASKCSIETIKINGVLNGKNVEGTQSFVQYFAEFYPGAQITKNSVISKDGYTYKFFANGACDIDMKNCGIAIERNGKKICRYYVGQSSVVEVK